MRVIDASVALKWVLPEHDTGKADSLRGQLFIAPDVFAIEVANALSRAARKNLLSAAEAVIGLTDIISSGPELRASGPLLFRALEISLTTRCSVYDAHYVALAEHEGVQLITADERLANNLQRDFPFLVRLADV